MRSYLAVVLFCHIPAWAGNRVGNGGDVVLCTRVQEAIYGKIQLLDFYEMQTSEKPLVKVRGSNVDSILSERLEVLRKVAPKLAEQYTRRAASLQNELQFKKGVALTDVKDSEHAYLPAAGDCKLRQIVIRQNVPVGDKRFLVDKALWDDLAPASRAGLILHEVVYEHFFKLGEMTSVKARRLNGLIFSPELDVMSTGKFWLFVKNLEVPLYP